MDEQVCALTEFNERRLSANSWLKTTSTKFYVTDKKHVFLTVYFDFAIFANHKRILFHNERSVL